MTENHRSQFSFKTRRTKMSEYREMDRRAFLKVTAGSAAAAALAACDQTWKMPSKDRPNVIFLFDDQLRTDVCGVYAGENIATPNIDRLARQGMTFSHAISSCPICSPYRGMVHTGRYPTHSGILMNFLQTNPAQNPNCLANVFGSAGYDTGFIGKWHLSAGRCREEGLYEYSKRGREAYLEINPEPAFEPPGPGRLGYDHWSGFNFHVEFNNYWYYRDEPKKIYSGRYETDTQIDQAIDYIKNHKESGKPFFLTIAPHPPHPPFTDSCSPKGYPEKVPENIKWSPNVTEDDPRRDVQMRYYLAMAQNVDDNLGRLLTYLDESGTADNTILIFTSDHGEMFGSHGRMNKMVPYTEAMSIPLIMRWPNKIKAGSRCEAVQTPMDHLPTLCGLAGITIPREADGVDLRDVIAGGKKSSRQEALIGNYTSNWDYFQSGTNWPEWRGVYTGRYTYFRWLMGEEELYDNIEDPYQMKNLALGRKEIPLLNRMRSRLKELLVAAHDDFQPGTAYGRWFDEKRNLTKTGLGPVPS